MLIRTETMLTISDLVQHLLPWTYRRCNEQYCPDQEQGNASVDRPELRLAEERDDGVNMCKILMEELFQDFLWRECQAALFCQVRDISMAKLIEKAGIDEVVAGVWYEMAVEFGRPRKIAAGVMAGMPLDLAWVNGAITEHEVGFWCLEWRV